MPQREYPVDAPLRVTPPQRWREAPALYLGPQRDAWALHVLELILGDVADPERDWTRATLAIDRDVIHWEDDSSAPWVPANAFWPEACATLVADGSRLQVRLDALIHPTWNPEDVLRLVERTSARHRAANVELSLEGSEVVHVARSWRDYLAQGGHVLESVHWTSGDVDVDVVTVGGAPSVDVEVVERGVRCGLWPAVQALGATRFRATASVRIVAHTERRAGPTVRERAVNEALRAR